MKLNKGEYDCFRWKRIEFLRSSFQMEKISLKIRKNLTSLFLGVFCLFKEQGECGFCIPCEIGELGFCTMEIKLISWKYCSQVTYWYNANSYSLIYRHSYWQQNLPPEKQWLLLVCSCRNDSEYQCKPLYIVVRTNLLNELRVCLGFPKKGVCLGPVGSVFGAEQQN